MEIKIKVDGKFGYYEVLDKNCKTAKCLVPFTGNGQAICRLYELGRCKKINEVENEKQ